MQDLSGQAIKGYELHELIGAGGFGAVYRAYQPLIKRDVAIKVILPEYANQPDFIRSFEYEAQLVARLEHIHIVALYDYWRDPKGAYLVMRWLRGGSLRQRLKRGAIDNTLRCDRGAGGVSVGRNAPAWSSSPISSRIMFCSMTMGMPISPTSGSQRTCARLFPANPAAERRTKKRC
jgi:serine/threonine protein kinase